MLTFKLFRAALIAVAMIAFTACCTGQEKRDSGPSMVPSNATAFIHVNLAELMKTPSMKVPAEIAAGVQKEADDLFESTLGIKISELQQITYVLPTVDSIMEMQAGGEQDGFALFTFSSEVKAKLIMDSMPGTWNSTSIGSYTVFEDEDSKNALFLNSENTIAFGTKDGVKWFVKNRRNQSAGGLRPALELADSGHVTLGVNGQDMPDEIKMFVPDEMKSIVSAESAAVSLNFETGLAITARMNFESASIAADAAQFVEKNRGEAKAWLKRQEASTLDVLNDEAATLNEAMEQLAMLAVYRYGDKLIDQTTIDQTENQIQARMAIDGMDGNVLLIGGLTAIQAIGNSAESEFEAIAEELSR